MTVKEAIEYIISESKKDESLLTDTNRFKAYLSDLAPEYKEKGLNVIKKNLDSDFLEICFNDKEDVRRRVSRIKYRLEKDGLAEHWIDFIIDSFFTPLGWKPPKDEEETSQTQKQQTQKQQIQNQQTQKQQIQNQQTQKQQTQKQQTQNQQTQNQQIQNQQTQNQQTQKQQTQNQQTQKQQTQKQQTQNQQTQNQQTQKQQTQNQQIQNQQIQNQQIQKTKKQQIQKRNLVKFGLTAILILIGLFILAIIFSSIIFSNSNKNDIKEPVRYSTIETKRNRDLSGNSKEPVIYSTIEKANVGDYIKFGSYTQNSSGKKKPIEWQVLAKENNKMLVISRYGLDAKRFDSSSNVWSNSEIRKWLNGDFYNEAFSEQEKKSINLSNLSDVGTSDNVFLLSREEAEKYFSNNAERRCKATEYAVKNGAHVADSSYGDNAGYSHCWLRSPDPYSDDYVYLVFNGGYINFNSVFNVHILARPALWINL